MNFPLTKFLNTASKFKWTENCRRVYTFSMKDSRLMKFHAAVLQLRVHSVEFLVLLRFTFPVPVVGAENKKISCSRSFTLEKNFESTRGHVYPFMSIFTCYDVCHVRKKIQYHNENLLAKRVTYIYIYLWYQESGLNYVGQGMITGRQVFLYYLSRERLD